MTRGTDKKFDPEIVLDKAMQLIMGVHQAVALIGRVMETPEVKSGIVGGALAVLESP